jgi:hypothetical protein
VRDYELIDYFEKSITKMIIDYLKIIILVFFTEVIITIIIITCLKLFLEFVSCIIQWIEHID